jgi:excisionase family DNA binding protein
MRLRKEAFDKGNGKMVISTKKLMTAQELADFWRVTRRSIYNLVSAGTIPVKPIKIGKRILRWRTSEVEQYMSQQ